MTFAEYLISLRVNCVTPSGFIVCTALVFYNHATPSGLKNRNQSACFKSSTPKGWHDYRKIYEHCFPNPEGVT